MDKKINKCSKCQSLAQHIIVESHLPQRGVYSFVRCHMCDAETKGSFSPDFQTAIDSAIEEWNKANPEEPKEKEFIPLEEYLNIRHGIVHYTGKNTRLHISSGGLIFYVFELTDGCAICQNNVFGDKDLVFPSYEKALEHAKGKIKEEKDEQTD